MESAETKRAVRAANEYISAAEQAQAELSAIQLNMLFAARGVITKIKKSTANTTTVETYKSPLDSDGASLLGVDQET
jgi:hypothetical protein